MITLESLQWWHLVLSMLALLIGFSLNVFGRGFKHWAETLDKLSARFNARLDIMDESNDKRWSTVEQRISQQEAIMNSLRIQIEHRITHVEATIRKEK